MSPEDRAHLKAMRACGVRWKPGRALPTYPAGMSTEQRLEADRHYDAMSEAACDEIARGRPPAEV